MTTYPGDDPQTPDDQQDPATQRPEDDVPTTGEADGTEPTQPVGYWERRASEQAAEHPRAEGGRPYPTTPYPQGGPVFNPTSAQASAPAQPAPSPYDHGPYGPLAPASYGGQPPGQPPAPGQPAAYAPMPGYAGFVAPPPDHPQATLSLVLGLVGLIGAFVFCGVTLVVSPFAWAIGQSALKEIRASQGRLGGESPARTGMILGIIGTVLLLLAVVAVIGFIFLIALSGSTTTGSSV
jgi:hypothetical protein